jgi:hypothetical protein
MNHRIANNLALIAAIVELDGRAVSDPQAAIVLAATQRRIHAVASVHRALYREPLAETVNLGVFLDELGDSSAPWFPTAGTAGQSRSKPTTLTFPTNMPPPSRSWSANWWEMPASTPIAWTIPARCASFSTQRHRETGVWRSRTMVLALVTSMAESADWVRTSSSCL